MISVAPQQRSTSAQGVFRRRTISRCLLKVGGGKEFDGRSSIVWSLSHYYDDDCLSKELSLADNDERRVVEATSRPFCFRVDIREKVGEHDISVTSSLLFIRKPSIAGGRGA